MTLPRLPEEISQVHYTDVQNTFTAYRPDFWQNVQLGYIKDSEVFNMGSKVLGLASQDGIVNAKYKGAAPSTGPIPREYDYYGSIGLPATDTVRAVSTSANDTSFIRIRGCRSDGIEVEEYMRMDGLNVVESQTLWLTVHWAEYMPYLNPGNSKQYYNEGEITFSDPALDPFPSMIMEAKTCRATNSIYRCPKYMKAFIVDNWYHVIGQATSQALFYQDENRYVSVDDTNYGWHRMYENPVGVAGEVNPTQARRSIDDGDYWALSVSNAGVGFINAYWGCRIVQCVIDYAPQSYKLTVVLPV